MVKFRTVASIIASALCAAAVIGSGFAAWSFSKSQRQDINFNVLITQSTLAGEFIDPVVPVLAVLDEGMSGTNSTITGVSFYKSANTAGRQFQMNGMTFNEPVVVDPDLSISFRTYDAMSKDEVDALAFGFRVRSTGKVAGYLRKTSYYTAMKKQTSAPVTDGFGDYIDLKALALTPGFDGSVNYSEVQNADGVWTLTFHFTTFTLNSFYTFADGKRPSDKALYDGIDAELGGHRNGGSGEFLIELWQGW